MSSTRPRAGARPAPSTAHSHHGMNTATPSQEWSRYHDWNSSNVASTAPIAAPAPTRRRQSGHVSTGTRNAVASRSTFSIFHGAIENSAAARPSTQNVSGG